MTTQNIPISQAGGIPYSQEQVRKKKGFLVPENVLLLSKKVVSFSTRRNAFEIEVTILSEASQLVILGICL